MEEGLGICQDLINFIIHLAYFSDVFIVILLDYLHNIFLLSVQSIPHSINVVVRLLNKFTVQFYVKSLETVYLSVDVLYLLLEKFVLYLLGV
jgi:hypothetical protein